MRFPRPHMGACAIAALALISVPSAAGAQSGGAPAPGAAPVAPADPGAFLVSSKRAAFVDRAVTVKGIVPDAAGRAVSLQVAAGGGWAQVGTAQGDATGSFSATWTPSGQGRYRLRAVIAAATSAQQGAGLASVPREVTVYEPAKATWYGPGFYGHELACGGKLTKTTLGIAHRELPCGTKVAISYRGRSIEVPVIDRGPYANGADVDLTYATARRLGALSTVRLGLAELQSAQP